jgi:hypothetical protein
VGHPDFKPTLCLLKSSGSMGAGFTQLSLPVPMPLKKRIQRRKGLNGYLAGKSQSGRLQASTPLAAEDALGL